jgi:hypothetical protein
MESVAEAVAGIAFVALVASGFLVLGSLLARPGNSRFDQRPPSEVARTNPEAGFYMALGARLALFMRLALGSATVLALAVVAVALL